MWAEQVTFNLANGSSSDTSVSPVSLTTSGSFQTDNVNSYRSGLKIEAGQYIELTADAGYSISQVQITFTPDDNNNPISHIRSGSLTSITINTDETATWGQTFSNKNYSDYGVLTRTLENSKSSIKFSFDGSSSAYVYVKQLDVTYSVDNRSEIAVFSSTNTWPTEYNYVDNAPSSMTIHGPQNDSNSSFVIKIVATNGEVTSGTYENRFDTNKLHVSVQDPTVITLGTVHHQNYSGTSGSRQQMYFSDFTILKEGSTRIVVSFDGDENYLPKTVCYNITTKNIRHSSLYSSYPFTWDFANNDWESSKIQMAANSTGWSSYEGEGRSKQTSVSATSGIDMIEGLAFGGLTADNGSTHNGSLCLDWTTKAVWLNGTVTLPALSMGHKVTIVSAAAPTSVPSDFKLLSSTGTDRVTTIYQAKTDISAPALTFDGKHVYSIKVEKSDFTFSERKTQIYSNIVTKAASYTGTAQFFWIQANIPDFITNLSGLGITVTSSNSTVISTSGWSNETPSGGTVWFQPFTTGTIGTAVLTFNFPGSAGFNPSSFSVTLNVIKGDPLLTFTSNDKDTHEIAYAAGSYSGNPLTYRSGVTTSKIEYSSNDTNVAIIDKKTGAITINNAGKAVIRAVFEGDAYYNGAETFYTLYAKGTSSSATVTWNNSTLESTKELTIVKAANSVQTATSSDNATVYYKSSDSDIVTVDNEGHIFGRNPGVATVTAYTKGSGSQEGAETSCTVTVNGGVMSFEFIPSSGTMTVGCQLMPRLKIPSLEKSDITSLTLSVVTESESGVVTVVPNLLLDEYLSMAATRIEKVYPLITANKVGTATVRATLVSPYYDDGNGGHTFTTDFNVTVTTETALFNWRNGSSAKTEYTITEGEYMMMPAIENSANGNINGLSNGSVCQSRHGYVYSIINGTPEWNNDDYYYGQGVPDYSITPANGTAYIFWAKGEDTNHPVLMIYGKSAGDVTLRATDSQTGFSPADITIHVVSKADRVTGPDATFWSNKTFPFTWDFTNISAADITDDDVHWRKYTFNQSDPYGNTVTEHEHILGMTTSFPYDYADEDNNGVGYKGNNGSATAQLLKKYFVNGEGASCKIMPAFHGLRLQLGNNGDGSFWSKRDKVKLYDKDDSNGGRLFLEGGWHFLYLPAMSAENRPASAYRLYMKLKGRSNDSEVALYYSKVEGGVNTDDFVYGGSNVKPGNDAARCYYFDIPLENAGKKVALAFDKNVEVYWIAFSTEAKNIPKPITNEFLTYAAASYSYNADLDISKSLDANDGVTAYYASGFIKDDKGISAGSDNSGDDEGDYAVKMSPLNGAVPANTGILLKKASPDDCYMIVNAKNMKSEQYSDPDALSTNYLKGTGSGVSVSRTTTIGDDTYSNFAISHAYKYYKDITDPSTVQGGYRFNRDWSFYPIMGNNANIAAQKAYLQIPGNLYVNKNGEIVDLPASSRASWRAADDDDAPVAPASKAALSIVFEDELPLSPENPDVTGVFDIERHADDNIINNGVWYNMEGMRISTPTKPGLYIRNGKKVFIK